MENDFKTMQEIRLNDERKFQEIWNAYGLCENQLELSKGTFSKCNEQRSNDAQIIKGLKRQRWFIGGGALLIILLLL